MITKQFVISLSLLSLFFISVIQAADTAEEQSISLQELRSYCSHLSPDTPITLQEITDFTPSDWGRVAAMLHGIKAQQVYFCGSRISDEGAANIAAIVGNMPYLTHLSLRATGISTAGLLEICDALNNRPQKEKYPLQYLDVRGNNLTTLTSIKSLESLAKGNPNFEIANDFFDKASLSDIIKKMRVHNKSTTELPGTTSCASPRRESMVDAHNCSPTPRIGEKRGLRGLLGLGNSQQSLGDK